MKSKAFRIGRVSGALRGQVWYLTYHQDGRRHRPRVGPDKESARQLAAQINSQLESGAPAALSFESIAIPELQSRWLRHHEQVLRSSVQTINRYRTATAHLLAFLNSARVPGSTSHFRTDHAAEFIQYLRTIEVAPNGHAHSRKRPLLDKGIKYILQTCRSMFTFAVKRRHLPPYAENPFQSLDLDRIPVENSKPVVIFTPDQERDFLAVCDDWQFPIFLTLTLTGLRPGELVHLLLPEDLDLDAGVLRVCNKARLGWQVKTRNEREIPLVPELVDVLKIGLSWRCTGPVFLRRRFTMANPPVLGTFTTPQLEREVDSRVAGREQSEDRPLTRVERFGVCRSVWRDAGVVKTDRLRTEFMRLTTKLGLPLQTAPKVLRHLFATSLQDANVDPLIRNELMGHSPGNSRQGAGLGMTSHYTHTRPETCRRQLQTAANVRSAIAFAREWLVRQVKRAQN